MIYPEQRGDYFSKCWNATEFNTQFNLLMDKEAFIATNEEGFIHLNLIGKIFQVIKSFFGGTDYSQKTRIQSAWLKFLYYGEAQGFISQEKMGRLYNRIHYSNSYFDPAVERLFKEMQNYRRFSSESKSSHLNCLRDIVMEYHNYHTSLLRPGFWTRFSLSPSLHSKKLISFGDTPLQLAAKAIKQEKPMPYLALNYLHQAFSLKNDSPVFQENLAKQLQELEQVYSVELTGQMRRIQELWIGLGETALENQSSDLAQVYLSHALQIDDNTQTRLQITKLYLQYKEYKLAKPFFSDLKKSFPGNLQLHIEIGHAYWQLNKFDKAMETYQAALNHPTIYGQEWLARLNRFLDSIKEKNKAQILSILLGCTENYFKENQNQKAHACLQKALILFKDDVNVKMQFLDLALQFGESRVLQSQFDEWKYQYGHNPYLQEKMGDSYWHSDKNQALEAYQRSIKLFDQKLLLCQEDEERITCQQHMARILTRIGQLQLQTGVGVFQKIPYDEAIKNLEKAVSLNSDLYSSLLFDTYLTAAQAEKQYTFPFLRDENKIMTYYQKAFDSSHQKGKYLLELMELYLNHKRYDEAIALYQAIQQQPWSKEFVLNPVLFSQLAQHLYNNIRESKDGNEETIKCLLDIAQNLEVYQQEGLHVEKLELLFQHLLVQIYRDLAEHHTQRCLLPQLEKNMTKTEIESHKKLHKEDIEQALNYYDKALGIEPENAALHFDKGLLLDWTVQFEEALKEFELAIKYQPRNPFYHKVLAPFYFFMYGNNGKKEEHEEIARKHSSKQFFQDYPIWKEEFMCQVKTKHINPHSYTKKKGWFG